MPTDAQTTPKTFEEQHRFTASPLRPPTPEQQEAARRKLAAYTIPLCGRYTVNRGHRYKLVDLWATDEELSDIIDMIQVAIVQRRLVGPPSGKLRLLAKGLDRRGPDHGPPPGAHGSGR